MFFDQLLVYNDLGLFILRLAIAVIFLYHGLPKLKNFSAMAQMMGMGNMGMMVLILGLVEALSSLGLILGVYVQLSALLLALVMLGAIKFKVIKWGMPFAAMDKTGWEFDLILLAACVALLLGGGGNIGIQ